MRPLSLLLALVLAACASEPADVPTDAPAEVPAEATASAPTPGATAPAFTLDDTDGTSHSLADYRGQTVVLEWLNYDCPYVGNHYGGDNMQALQAQAEADGVVWLAIVSSAPGEQGYWEGDEMNAETEERGGRQAAVLLDPTGEVGRAYDAQTTPHMFVIDEAGTLVYNGAVDDRPTSDLADLEGATSYVVPAIAAAREGRPADPATTQPYGCSVKYADGA
ncbi:redoxin family protein [Rubrivirga sp.]|uniref:redoxin family protein n=1 Tax=Rubrivirga sp. TaxID=1885344 RepID=UPI003B52D54F